VKDSLVDWALLWRQGSGGDAGSESLPANQATVPAEQQSRITCAARPAGVTLYIPFDC
jgi:hypothetical protein